MFLADYDLPTTTADCRQYEEPMRIWFDKIRPGKSVIEIWFSRPESVYWDPKMPRSRQDTIVEGLG